MFCDSPSARAPSDTKTEKTSDEITQNKPIETNESKVAEIEEIELDVDWTDDE